MRRFVLFALLSLGCLGLAMPAALAHALVLEARPAVNARVAGPDLPVLVQFNSRIDKSRSRLVLFAPDGSQRDLVLDAGPEEDRLSSRAEGLVPGKYRLRWFVLSIDGHLTRGDIPFEVTAP